MNRRLLTRSAYLLPIVAILLFAAWLRFRHLVDFTAWTDEIWSLWLVRGSFDDVMLRVPYDWPPLFPALTWGWMQVAGQTLEGFRALMVCLGVLTVAATTRQRVSG